MTIGERIKHRREELGMTQDELAHKLGYKSRSSINKIELNLYNLKQSKIKAIADALGTTPSYIMGWDEEANIQKVQKEVEISELIEKVYGKETLEMLSMFSRLDSVDKTVITSTIATLLTADKYSIQEESKHA